MGRQNNAERCIKVCSWNIAGLKDKLQEPRILNFVMGFDIVFILESKKFFNLTVPGFGVYANVSREGYNRGGVVMLVKCKLLSDVLSVNTDSEGQIWIVMSWWPSLKIGGIYIPPEDSPYFSLAQQGTLAAHTLPPGNIIAMGDFNARVGEPNIVGEDDQVCKYEGVRDITVNSHGRTLLNMCHNNDMIIVNNLTHNGVHYNGNLSFKRRDTWLSEIDLCLSSFGCLNMVKNLHVHQDVRGSDHAPLSITLSIDTVSALSAKELLQRSAGLCQSHHIQAPLPGHRLKKSVGYKDVDGEKFVRLLNAIPPPVIVDDGDVSEAISRGCDVIMDIAARSTKNTPNIGNDWNQAQPRWTRLLECNDSKLVWRSIDWKGNVEIQDCEQPNDVSFKEHFEKLLDPEGVPDIEHVDIEDNVPYIPVLDDPFSIEELNGAVKFTNKNKSYSGICPGIVGMLPPSWFLFILTLFNVIFIRVSYPAVWCYSKLVCIFKSGERLLCGNYRGISIMDTLAKIFDKMILNRLLLWCNINKCQAGAQEKRSCLEQILTLRLLCDYAVFKKVKLYVLFVDFSKAYDRVPRRKMIELLRDLGCGKRMLKAIQAMYKCTKHILKSAIINASVGVRQGAPTSCILFIIYIDRLVRMLSNAIVSDGFLGGLHVLLLMDDAVILATNREMCKSKLSILYQYCNDYGMVINEKKTKFYVINGEAYDREQLKVADVGVNYAPRYLYLGAWFTDSGKMDKIVALHETHSETIVNKFAIFCAANSQMPYIYKKKVFDAAVTSSLLYSSESWLTNNIRGMEKQYNKLLKCLLGVRKNTSSNLCMLETGILPVKDLIERRRKSFLISKREHVDAELPFNIVYDMCRDHNTPGYRFLSKTLQLNVEQSSIDRISNYVRDKAPNATKLNTYMRDFNPSMGTHEVYSTSKYIPDFCRESFSRLRLMSHNLRVETGRWSRTPAHLRTCPCDNTSVQTEAHVLTSCQLSECIRNRYNMLNFGNINDLMNETNYVGELCRYVYDVLSIYE